MKHCNVFARVNQVAVGKGIGKMQVELQDEV